MATRYWVGGSGTWDTSTTTNWSTSSGGAGGASAPTSVDDVVFDGNSGSSPIITLGNTRGVNLTTTGFNGTFAAGASDQLRVTGNITLSSTTTINDEVRLIFNAGSSQNFNPAGATIYGMVVVTANGIVSLQGNLILDYDNSTHTFNYYQDSTGSMDLNSYTLQGYNLAIDSGTFDFGTGKVVHSGPGKLGAGNETRINITWDTVTWAGSNRLIEITTPFAGYNKVCSGSASTVDQRITNSGVTIRVVAGPSSGGQIGFGTYFNTIDCNNQNFTFQAIGFCRVCGNFTIGGANVQFTKSSTPGGVEFFTAAGQTVLSKTISCNGGSFEDVYFDDQNNSTSTYTASNNFSCTGSFNFYMNGVSTAGTTVFNLNGKTLNCGTFNVSGSDTRTFTFGTGGRVRSNNCNLSTATNLTFSGTPLFEVKTPLTGTTNTFNSGILSTVVVSVVEESIGGTVSINGQMQGLTFANAIYNAAGSPTIYGDLVVSGSLPTFTGGTYTLAKSSGTQIINTNGATFNNTVNLNSASTTFRFDSAFTMGATGTLTLTTGTANFNGQAITVGILSSSNLNARTLAFGDSTVTVLGSGTSWNCATSTNLTITYGGAGRISMNSASAKTFAGGSKTWPTVNQGGAGTLTVTGSNTFTNFTNTVTGCTIAFPSGTTIFTNFNVRGAPGSLVTMSSTSTLYKASGLVAVNYLNLSNSTATGGARWYAGAGSTDGGGNTGWLFTTASTGGFLAFF